MIEIKHLNKTYQTQKNKICAVDDINLTIKEGEIFGLIGYSGAGKSTFIRLINRLEEPTSGEIWLHDTEVTALSKKDLRQARQNIGMIFQHFNLLWSRTVAKNIAFPLEIAGKSKEAIKARTQELIDLVGLTGREDAYISELSGGQKQRVGIARALANEPKLLLADEATSALDPETTEQILDLLVQINKKLHITIILITHEMQVIKKICDRVAVLDKGRVLETGPVSRVFNAPTEEVTRQFIKEEISEDLSDIKDMIQHEPEKAIYKLEFTHETSNQTLISHLAKTFPLHINILKAKMTQTQTGAYGTLYIQFIGDDQAIRQAVNYINHETTVGIEVIHNAH